MVTVISESINEMIKSLNEVITIIYWNNFNKGE